MSLQVARTNRRLVRSKFQKATSKQNSIKTVIEQIDKHKSIPVELGKGRRKTLHKSASVSKRKKIVPQSTADARRAHCVAEQSPAGSNAIQAKSFRHQHKLESSSVVSELSPKSKRPKSVQTERGAAKSDAVQQLVGSRIRRSVRCASTCCRRIARLAALASAVGS